MQVRFGELTEEIAIAHGLPLSEVETVLHAYSAAIRRLLAEEFIVEIADGLRVQVETYLDRHNNTVKKRVVVNSGNRLSQRKATSADLEIEEENERTAEKLRTYGDGDS
jgi:hypothetical protein